MPNKIMFAVGCCERQLFSAVKNSVLEKLNNTDKTAVSFQMLNKIPDAQTAMNQFFSKIDLNCNATRNRPCIPVLFDGDESKLKLVHNLLNDLTNIRENIGVWQFDFHLVWLLEEQPSPKYNYSVLLDEVLKENLFSHIYIISDKHSNLTNGKSERINGASLLISSILESSFSPGLYTIGVGKMRITTREMCDYARHKAVVALQNRAIRHDELPDMKSICSVSFSPNTIKNREQMIHFLRETAGEYLVTNFCYIDGDAENVSSVVSPNNVEFSAVFSQWMAEMKNRLCLTPFIEDAISFFSENGSFHQFVDEIEREASRHDSNDKVKPALLGVKKAVGIAYNSFIEERKKVVNELIQKFCNQWKDCKDEMLTIAKALKQKRDKYMLEYEKEAAFVTMCEQSASEVTNRINHYLAQIEFKSKQCGSFIVGTKEECEHQWEAFMQWIVAETKADQTTVDLLNGTATTDAGSVFTNLIRPIKAQTNVFLSCRRHNDFSAPNNIFYFLPSAFDVNALSSVAKDSTAHFISVDSYAYQNAEGIAILLLSEGGNKMAINNAAHMLTAFPDNNGTAPAYKMLHNIDAFQNEEDNNDTTTISTTAKEEKKQENNPWGMSVSSGINGYRLRMFWKDDSLESVRLIFNSRDQSDTPVFISKTDFLNRGYIDIDQYVGYGPHTVSLSTLYDNLGECAFDGRKYQVYLEISDSTLQLDDNTHLDRHDITVGSVDNDDGTPLPDIACQDLTLVLDGKDCILMPMPRIKHRKQTWRVFMAPVSFELKVMGENEGFYEIHY